MNTTDIQTLLNKLTSAAADLAEQLPPSVMIRINPDGHVQVLLENGGRLDYPAPTS